MVLRALSLFLGALSAEGFDVARRRTLHVAQRPLEFRLAAARRLAPLRSQYDEYDEALDEVEAASARLAKAKARLAKAARSAPRPRPIGARSLLDRSDAGTLLLTVPAAGMTSGTLMGGAFSAAWFSAIVPATFAAGSIVGAVFLAPFWLAGGMVLKQTILDPCLLYTSPSPRDATLSRMPSSA